MKQQLITLNHKFFNRMLNEATANDPTLKKNIRKTLNIPDISATENDYKSLKKFKDLFRYQNFDTATWIENIQRTGTKEGIKIIYLNSNGKTWQKLKEGHMFKTAFVDKLQAEIIILSETMSARENNIALPNYSQHTLNARQNTDYTQVEQLGG